MKHIVAMALFLPVLAVVGCGDSSGHGTQSSVSAATHTSGPAKLATVVALPLRRLQNDRDDDDEAGELIGRDPKDSDIDGDNDRARLWGFYDRDDSSVVGWGREAVGAQRRQLILFARRYYGLAVAGHGADACSMLTRTAVHSIPQDYGRGSAGPAYLKSARTCAQVLALLFTHLHAQLSAPIEVLRVRVRGDEALVLVGSATSPAADFELVREGGAWRSTAMLAYPLT